MQLAVLLGLAALWVAVLLPDILRRRTTRRGGDSITNFSRHLSVLERSNPIAPSARRAARRTVRQPIAPPTAPRVGAPRTATPRPSASNVVHMAQRTPQRPPQPQRPQTVRSHPARSQAHQARAAHAARPVRPPVPARPVRSSAHQRRQDVIVGLSAAALLSLLATVAFGGPMLYLHLLIDLLFVAYLGLLLGATNRTSSRAATPAATRGVTYLTPAQPERMAPVAAHSQRSSAAR